MREYRELQTEETRWSTLKSKLSEDPSLYFHKPPDAGEYPCFLRGFWNSFWFGFSLHSFASENFLQNLLPLTFSFPPSPEAESCPCGHTSCCSDCSGLEGVPAACLLGKDLHGNTLGLPVRGTEARMLYSGKRPWLPC